MRHTQQKGPSLSCPTRHIHSTGSSGHPGHPGHPGWEQAGGQPGLVLPQGIFRCPSRLGGSHQAPHPIPSCSFSPTLSFSFCPSHAQKGKQGAETAMEFPSSVVTRGDSSGPMPAPLMQTRPGEWPPSAEVAIMHPTAKPQ